MAEKQTDDFFLDATRKAEVINSDVRQNPVAKSFELLVRLFDKDDSLTPAEKRRARRFGVTSLVSLGVAVSAISAVTIVTGPTTPEAPNSPFVSDEDRTNLEEAFDVYSADEQVIGEFTITGRGDNPSEGLDRFLEAHPEVQVDPSNVEFSQWTAQESGKMLGIVHENDSVQVTLDDINSDGKQEIVLQHPLPADSSDSPDSHKN